MRNRCTRRISLLLLSLAALFWVSQKADAQNAQDILAANARLQEMGVALGSGLSPEMRGDLARSISAFRGEIENPLLAFKHGLGLADPRPTPLQPGTDVFFTISRGGKLTFYVDDHAFLRDADSQSTAVKVNNDLLPDWITVVNGAFSSR